MDDTPNSKKDQLQEALSKVSILTAELRKSTEIAEETDRRNTALHEELSRASVVNENLSHQLEQIHEEMSKERNQSVSVLEEELQKQHNLQSTLERAQQDLYEQETKMEALTEELQREHQLHEELRAKIQDLEQSLHEKESVGLEKELLQQTMSEKERNIEALEREVTALKRAGQTASSRNATYKDEVEELVSTTEELNSKLLDAVRATQEVEREKMQLQDKLDSVHAESAILRENSEDLNRTVERMKIEVKNLKDQNKNQVCKNYCSIHLQF